jgi:cobyrinic acid a,c-diamide synthase
MSAPRVLLVPTHRTGLADAVAAAATEIAGSRGLEVRYHHVGAMSPSACWDRWEGTVFLDPAVCSEEALLGLYDLAVRHAGLSILSSNTGVLDRREGAVWTPASVARLLDCPVAVVMDCRGWGAGIKVLTTGLRAHLSGVNWAGAILSGVANRSHYEVLRDSLAEEGVPVVGCLYEGEGPGWDTPAPGPWGLPLEASVLESVARQVDIDGLIALAGQRGFLSAPSRSPVRGSEGPVIAVASGKGFALWSRDSVEVLRAAGADARRVDLVEDPALPVGTAGLILAGTIWPATVPDIALNLPLLREIGMRIGQGMPTLAMGGGMLLLLDKIQDLLGRSSDLAGVVAAQGEILWDLEDPAYVEITSLRDNLLLAKGDKATGWVLTDAEVVSAGSPWDSPLEIRGEGIIGERGEGVGTDTLLCTPVLVHLAASREAASRFVGRCAAYAAHPGR